MDITQGQRGSELFQAQSHLFGHIFSFINSMSLKCAVQLGIPDVIHNHGKPITLSELITDLQIPPTKITHVYRLMRILVHSGIFARKKVQENNQEEEEEEEGYDLTPSSRLLIKDNITSQSPVAVAILNPVLVTPWHFLGDWFQGDKNENITAFETVHGMGLWDFMDQNSEFNQIFNVATASDSGLMSSVIRDCKPVFEGLDSLVDVGGGTGLAAKIILEAFPHLKCAVFDLPHVVANLPESENLSFVGGNMFQSVPSADALLFRLVFHGFSDEECVKILKRCREAIPSKDKKGKVIIIDMVIDVKNDEHKITETKLFYDMLMMAMGTGRERREKEWEKLFLEAGFSRYKITPMFGLRSLIEVYP